MANDNTTAKLVADLLRELSSEMDLHYEDNELPATAETIDVVRRGAAALKLGGHRIPEACEHILHRFDQSTGH